MSTRDAQRLAAGLDEDEAAAGAARRNPAAEWVIDPEPWAYGTGLVDGIGGVAVALGSYAADHIARHDPARVLADIAAKRQILALYEEFQVKRDQHTAHPQYAVEMACEVLGSVIAALAGAYQDTPAETR